MMRDCKEMRRAIDRRTAGAAGLVSDLDPNDSLPAAVLDDHLAACEACRAYRAGLQRVDRLLASELAPTVGAELLDGILAGVGDAAVDRVCRDARVVLDERTAFEAGLTPTAPSADPAVDVHLAGCVPCREYAAQMARVDAILTTEPDARATAALTDGVLAAIGGSDEAGCDRLRRALDERTAAATGLVDAPAPAPALDAHLDVCAACRAHEAALARVDGLLATEPTPPAPADLVDRVLRAIPGVVFAARPLPASVRWLRAAAGVAIAACVIAVAVLAQTREGLRREVAQISRPFVEAAPSSDLARWVSPGASIGELRAIDVPSLREVVSDANARANGAVRGVARLSEPLEERGLIPEGRVGSIPLPLLLLLLLALAVANIPLLRARSHRALSGPEEGNDRC